MGHHLSDHEYLNIHLLFSIGRFNLLPGLIVVACDSNCSVPAANRNKVSIIENRSRIPSHVVVYIVYVTH